MGDSLLTGCVFLSDIYKPSGFPFKRRKIFPNLFKRSLIRESLDPSNYFKIYFEERRKGRHLNSVQTVGILKKSGLFTALPLIPGSL